MKYGLFIFLILVEFLTLKAQLPERASKKHTSWLAMPAAFYTPETSVGGGIILTMHHTPKDSLLNESNGQFYLDVTFMKQVQLQHDHNTYFRIKGLHFFSIGSFDFSRFPEKFFGIGNNTKKSDACFVDFKLFNIRQFLYYQLKPFKYIGIVIQHQQMHDLSKEIKTPDYLYSHEGYTHTGFGASYLLDKRNNMLNPKKGHYVQVGMIRYKDHDGGTDGYTNTWLDARHYKSLKYDVVINSNICAFNNFGVVPYRMMPYLGGSRFLRGYYAGRFRDNNAVVARTEFRKRIVGRFGIAAFGDLGKVYNSLNNLQNNSWNHTYGVGLRITQNLKTDANIRIDYGRGKDSHGLYIVFAEAF